LAHDPFPKTADDASMLDGNREIPAWVDGALRKAVHPDPRQRYRELSEFLFDLRRQPNGTFLEAERTPLLERNPLLFWKCASAALVGAVLVLIFLLSRS
jgi:hypothetical protein